MIFALNHPFESFPQDLLAELPPNRNTHYLLKGIIENNENSFEVIKDAVLYLHEHPKLARFDGSLLQTSADGFLKRGKTANALSLVKAVPLGKKRETLVKRVFRNLSGEPQEALSHLQSLDQSTDRLAAVEAIAGTWVTSEPERTVAWVKALENSAESDAAKKGVAAGMRHRDPASALEWANSIEDEEVRNEELKFLIPHLKVTNPELLE